MTLLDKHLLKFSYSIRNPVLDTQKIKEKKRDKINEDRNFILTPNTENHLLFINLKVTSNRSVPSELNSICSLKDNYMDTFPAV